MTFAHITGTGSALPQRILDNAGLEMIVDTTDEWITRRTGIKERRIAMSDKNESTTDLGALAARRAMEMANVSANEIDTIITANCFRGSNIPIGGVHDPKGAGC